jgi:hypothetical protein
MKPRPFVNSRPARRMLAFTGAAVRRPLSLAGCAGLKDQYAASRRCATAHGRRSRCDTKAGEHRHPGDIPEAGRADAERRACGSHRSPTSTHSSSAGACRPNRAACAPTRCARPGRPCPQRSCLQAPDGHASGSAGYHGLGLLAGGTRQLCRGGAAAASKPSAATPTDAVLLSDLGYAYLRAGQIAEARLPLMQALQLRPTARRRKPTSRSTWKSRSRSAQADALMEANRMSPASRAAIRESAQQLAAAPRPARGSAQPQSHRGTVPGRTSRGDHRRQRRRRLQAEGRALAGHGRRSKPIAGPAATSTAAVRSHEEQNEEHRPRLRPSPGRLSESRLSR